MCTPWLPRNVPQMLEVTNAVLVEDDAPHGQIRRYRICKIAGFIRSFRILRSGSWGRFLLC
jgi:hypothetical protein